MAGLPGKALAQELIVQSREESRRTPMEGVVQAANEGSLSDEQHFRLIGRLWTLERMFYYVSGGWGQGLELNDFPAERQVSLREADLRRLDPRDAPGTRASRGTSGIAPARAVSSTSPGQRRWNWRSSASASTVSPRRPPTPRRAWRVPGNGVSRSGDRATRVHGDGASSLRAFLVEAWLPAQTAIARVECRPSRRRDGIFPKERSHADTDPAGPSDRAIPPRQSAGCPHLVQAERYAAAQHRHRVSAGWSGFLVFEGKAELTHSGNSDPETLRLARRKIFSATTRRRSADWEQYDRIAAADKRVAMVLRPDHIYGSALTRMREALAK